MAKPGLLGPDLYTHSKRASQAVKGPSGEPGPPILKTLLVTRDPPKKEFKDRFDSPSSPLI
jgi:hypothetical protein